MESPTEFSFYDESKEVGKIWLLSDEKKTDYLSLRNLAFIKSHIFYQIRLDLCPYMYLVACMPLFKSTDLPELVLLVFNSPEP